MKPMENGYKVPTLQTSKTDGCKAAGGHFNPFSRSHGGPDDDARHVGDLGNIITPEGAETTTVDIVDDIITLFDGSEENIASRTLVIHEGEDDLGDGGTPDSGTTGNAGGRVACGIVELRARPMEMSCSELCGEDFKGPVASINVVGSSEDSPVNGNLLMIQVNAESRVFVRGDINGLQPGPHGFHIHELGSTDGK